MFFFYIALTVVLISALMVILTRLMAKMMGKLGGQTFQRLYESAEFITETGRVPPFWTEKLRSKRRHQAEHSSKKKCMRQMKKLIQFASNTSTVADEETRQILIRALTRVEREWAEMSWNEMTSEG
ncbi:MAG: hypothetical protein HN368_05870 [Spirochaetales bacterium]|jgi:hypothetical protein|nr:hypothetical protein [Spirochaetales bacterium]